MRNPERMISQHRNAIGRPKPDSRRTIVHCVPDNQECRVIIIHEDGAMRHCAVSKLKYNLVQVQPLVLVLVAGSWKHIEGVVSPPSVLWIHFCSGSNRMVKTVLDGLRYR